MGTECRMNAALVAVLVVLQQQAAFAALESSSCKYTDLWRVTPSYRAANGEVYAEKVDFMGIPTRCTIIDLAYQGIGDAGAAQLASAWETQGGNVHTLNLK